MFELFRIALLTGALIIFIASLILRILKLRGCDRPVPAWAEDIYEPGMIREFAGRRKKLLYSELIRLMMDFCICLIILLTDIYFSWFHLFRESISGFFAGFSLLITFTLLVSVGVDWLQLRFCDRSHAMERRDKLRFLAQEIISILLIEIGMNIVLVSIWGLSKLHAGIPCVVTVSFLALLLYQAILLRMKNSGRHLRELREGGLKTRIMALLATEGYPVRNVLIRVGGKGSASYGVNLQGMRNHSLILDCRLICTLSEEEICSVVMHRLELNRQRLWLRERLFRGAQSVAAIASLSGLPGYIESGSLRGGAAPAGLPDLLRLSVPIIGCVAGITILQLLRNDGIKKMMMKADRTVVEKGEGTHLRNALIQTAETEMLNPVPAYELMISKPEFLPSRIDRIDQELRNKKGEHKNGSS